MDKAQEKRIEHITAGLFAHNTELVAQTLAILARWGEAMMSEYMRLNAAAAKESEVSGE